MMLPHKKPGRPKGFTLLELVAVLAILGVLATIAFPVGRRIYSDASIKAVAWEVAALLREAKQRALVTGEYQAVTFSADSGRIALVSGRGEDETWNTPDDPVVRSFRLADKNRTLSFGHGARPAPPGLSTCADGISFPQDACICNPDLTGNAGTVYIQSADGPAMALVMNSSDFGYKIWRWNGSQWSRL